MLAHPPLRCTLAALAILSTACSATAQDVRVASIGDRTGPIKGLVETPLNSRALAAQHVNDQGGLYANGRRLTLVPADSACDPEAAVPALLEIIDTVEVVIGPNCSGATVEALKSVTLQRGKLVISDTATSPDLSEMEDSDLFFRTAASDTNLGTAMSAMVLNRGFVRLAVTYAPDSYNAGVARSFEREIVANGGEIVASIEHPTEGSAEDYARVVAELQAIEADALAVFAYYNASGAPLMDAVKTAGGYRAYLGADTMAEDDFVAAYGADELTYTLFFVTSANVRAPAYRAYEALATEAGLQPDAIFAANAYDAAFLTALALEKNAADPTLTLPEAMRAVAGPPGEYVMPGEWALAKRLIAEGKDIDYDGAAGYHDFDTKGDVTGVYAVKWVNPDESWEAVNIE
ncbi:MAG: ABC transporter substrate-binding protein [Pseudomonadota bacterium]